MIRIIRIVLLSFCINSLSYAYGIDSNLTVVNNTGVDMKITVGALPFQPSKPTSIPAHSSITLDLTIGGWELWKDYRALFNIESDDTDKKLLVQGRVNYYVRAWPSEKYNFLDSVTAAEGLRIDLTYSCFGSDFYENGYPFKNKIVINDTPVAALQPKDPKDFPAAIHCRGVKSSILSDDHASYTRTCTNGEKDSFSLKTENHDDEKNNSDFIYTYTKYVVGDSLRGGDPWPIKNDVSISISAKQPDNAKIKESLDNTLNNGYKMTWLAPNISDAYRIQAFCGSW